MEVALLIHFVQKVVDPGFAQWNPGEIADLAEERAKRYIELGWAELAMPPRPMPSTSALTAPPVDKMWRKSKTR